MYIEIIKYNKEYNQLWDNFVLNESLNGTIYHTRLFLSYHGDKFIDSSILFKLNEELVCVVPCCINGDKYFSHKGATYGGPVLTSKKLSVSKVEKIIDEIFNYYNNNFECRLANDIYFSKEINLLYYLIGRKLNIKLELSWYIDTREDFMLKITNKRNKKYLEKMKNDKKYKFISTNNIQDYYNYYDILNKNLYLNHSTRPTHSIEEFILLKELLSDNQELFIIKDNSINIIVGGVFVIKVTPHCWYTFYISRNIDINGSGISIIYLMSEISKIANKNNVKYLDYGISTENGGEIINNGLSEFKNESLIGKSNYRYLLLKN